MRELNPVFKALSEGTRLRILKLLEKRRRYRRCSGDDPAEGLFSYRRIEGGGFIVRDAADPEEELKCAR
jgi:DNA-binding transcriptional ArsR family regulator